MEQNLKPLEEHLSSCDTLKTWQKTQFCSASGVGQATP